MGASMDDSFLDTIAQAIFDSNDADHDFLLPDAPGEFDFSLPLATSGELPALEKLTNGSLHSSSTLKDPTEAGCLDDSIENGGSDHQLSPSSNGRRLDLTATDLELQNDVLEHGPLVSSPFEWFVSLPGSKRRPEVDKLQYRAQQPPQRRSLDVEAQRSPNLGHSGIVFTKSSSHIDACDRALSKSLPCRRASTGEHENGLQAIVNFKEKNRAAQRRHRVRQKEKLQISEDKVADLTQQLQTVHLAQDALSQHNVMLERLLSMQKSGTTETPEATGGRPAVEEHKDAWWLDSEMKDFMENAFSLEGELVFTVRPDAPLRLTQIQVAALSDHEFDSMWERYINAFALLLIEAKGDPDTDAGRRLARLLYEGGLMKASLLISAPGRFYYKLVRTRVGSDSEVWRSLILSSRLSEEQKRAIVALRGLYLRNLGLLSRCREDLTAVLQAELDHGCGYKTHPGLLPNTKSGGVKPTLECAGSLLPSDTYSHTLTTMDSLRDILRDEQICLVQFLLTVVRRVLTPMQCAHIHVTCHPFHVDILSIAETLAQQAGEPKSSHLMNAASVEPRGTKLVPLDQALPRSMRAYTRPGVDLLALYPHLSPQQPLDSRLDFRQQLSPSSPGKHCL